MAFVRHVLLVLSSVAIGCGPVLGVDDADGSASADDTTTSTTSMSTTGVPPNPSTTGDPSGDETGPPMPHDLPPPSCDNPNFTCSTPIDCAAWSCGDLGSPFDADGCLRPSCETDGDCSPAEVCFTPIDWGLCHGSGLSCHDDPAGTCECIGDADCGGSYCVPENDAPPSSGCSGETEEACMDSGCMPEGGRPITASGSACLCDLETLYCIWRQPGASVQPGATAYMRLDDLEVVAFSWQSDPPPLGWIACKDVAFPPPACICAENLPCAGG
jgi:hypothetical protein